MSKNNWNGSKWIRQDARLAIYLRDGLACCYCGATVETGAILSLDHITPRSLGGNNDHTNLVTCCKKCNSSRGNRSIIEFCNAVAVYLNHGVTGEQIHSFIRETTKRPLSPFRGQAREIISKRSTFAEAIAEAAKTG